MKLSQNIKPAKRKSAAVKGQSQASSKPKYSLVLSCSIMGLGGGGTGRGGGVWNSLIIKTNCLLFTLIKLFAYSLKIILLVLKISFIVTQKRVD